MLIMLLERKKKKENVSNASSEQFNIHTYLYIHVCKCKNVFLSVILAFIQPRTRIYIIYDKELFPYNFH
jgi:hypothetical protein